MSAKVAKPPRLWSEIQIWAVRGWRIAVQVFSPSAHVSFVPTLSALTPYLRRQLLAYGKRLWLSVQGELVIVELSSGQLRRLGTQGVCPPEQGRLSMHT